MGEGSRSPARPPTADARERRLAAVRRRRRRPLRARGGILSKPITTWQVWDTANRGSPKGYDQLLEATFRTINLADPGARVLTGALSFAPGKGTTNPTKLLKRLMNPKVNQTFSAVGVSPQARSVGKVKKQLKSVRRVLDKAGRGGDGIWVTPIGWASDKRSSKAMSVGKRRPEAAAEAGDEVAPPWPRDRRRLLDPLARRRRRLQVVSPRRPAQQEGQVETGLGGLQEVPEDARDRPAAPAAEPDDAFFFGVVPDVRT